MTLERNRIPQWKWENKIGGVLLERREKRSTHLKFCHPIFNDCQGANNKMGTTIAMRLHNMCKDCDRLSRHPNGYIEVAI
jgi:hypothetical protein